MANLLWRMERFNGTGYQARGMNSPYVWSFTNQYEKGKYTGDGVFDADFVDGQSGTAAILLRLYEKGAISLLGESISVTVAGKSTTIPAYIVRGNSWIGARALADATGATIASVEDSPRTITLSKGGQTNGKMKAIAAQVIGGVGYVDASDAAVFLGRAITYTASTRVLGIS